MINKAYLLSSFIAFALMSAFSSLLLTGCNESGGISSGLKKQIDNVVECEMLEKQVPGISISVLRDGGLPGYSAEVLRYLDDSVSVIVLSNIKDGSFKPVNLAAEIAKLVRESGE